ncbi:MAG TPA: glycosyltransferase [bacterium]
MINEQSTKSDAVEMDFFQRCYERFLKAKESAGEVHHCYRVAETIVRLVFAGENLVPHLTPALEHLRISDIDRLPDLTLCIWDSESTSVEMVSPPCRKESLTDRGDIWGFRSSRIKTAFHWIECSVNLMDHSARTGMYWVQNAGTLPYWAHACPLRTLFHWWVEKNGCQLLHGAAVGTEDGAVLITGKGGVGKSTTALSCLQSGLYYLADDYLIVRLEPEPLAYSLYCTAGLTADHILKFPDFSRWAQSFRVLGEEKAVMFLYPQFAKQIASEMPLKAILLPQRVNLETSMFTPAPTWEVQRATSFTTMSQLPYVGRHTHDYICRLSSNLPGYIFEVGRDLRKIPVAISDFLKNQPNGPRGHHTDLRDPADSDKKPLVSVIIPVLNGEYFIKDAVANVLSQNYPALELIIVDDGSTDRTGEIISQLPCDIRYFKQDNGGPASARNRGIRDASGEFIAFLDVDDLWPENNLRVLVDELLRDPEIEVIHGYGQLMGKNPETNNYEYIGSPKESFRYYIGAGVYRRSVFAKVGLFDTTLVFGEDTDWFNRAREGNVRIKRIEDVTLLVRRHGRNMTHGKNLVELNALRTLKKALDRKRANETHPIQRG